MNTEESDMVTTDTDDTIDSTVPAEVATETTAEVWSDYTI